MSWFIGQAFRSVISFSLSVLFHSREQFYFSLFLTKFDVRIPSRTNESFWFLESSSRELPCDFSEAFSSRKDAEKGLSGGKKDDS